MKRLIIPILAVAFAILVIAAGTALDPWRLDERKITPEQVRQMELAQCYKGVWERVTFTPGETTKDDIRRVHERIKDYCEEEVDK